MNSFAVLVAAVTVSAPLEKAWYAPHELLPVLARRDGIRWAMPQTLAGRAWVGGHLTCKAVLDDACKQWGMSWTEANGVVVVHRAEANRLRMFTTALKGGGPEAPAAAWELGWLRDARALPALAEALTGKDPSLALAAAQAIDTLLTDIPLGREERVDPALPGRVSLAAAFPPKVDLLLLLESAYPPVRAASLRVLLGQGGKIANAAREKSASDRSKAVMDVRQQFSFRPQADRQPRKPLPSPPPPRDPAELQAACAKWLEEMPGLEKKSAWEEMTRRAEVLAAWSRAGHDPATDALIELTTTKVQQFWYPGIVQKCLATSGGDKVRAKLKQMMPKAHHAFIVRGLEESFYGADLVALTGPHLADPTVCYVTTRKAGREALDLLLP